MSSILNHWSVWSDAFFLWNASPPLRVEHPRDLLDWTLAIIDLGEECGVARFRRPSGESWSREALRDELERGFTEELVVDAFEFSRVIGRVASRLAYHDDSGIVEDWVLDPGALLSALSGATRDDTNAVRSASPLWIGGHAISFGDSGRGLRAERLPSTSLDIQISCDIWLPWVRGWRRPDDRDVIYDNRDLASRHTPRLNTFLAGVRDLTLRRGGTWRFFNYSGPNWLDRIAGPDGIRLDADVPTVREVWGR
jgi:hypothetical protein